MLFNFACSACQPEPLPAFVTGAVIDHMLDIPPFLRRELVSPFLGTVAETETQSSLGSYQPPGSHKPEPKTETGINRFRSYETDEDRRQRRVLLQQEAAGAGAQAEAKKAADAARRDAKKEERARVTERKMKQRQVFVKSFKWGVDGL
jgi:hypothetical protein